MKLFKLIFIFAVVFTMALTSCDNDETFPIPNIEGTAWTLCQTDKWFRDTRVEGFVMEYTDNDIVVVFHNNSTCDLWFSEDNFETPIKCVYKIERDILSIWSVDKYNGEYKKWIGPFYTNNNQLIYECVWYECEEENIVGEIDRFYFKLISYNEVDICLEQYRENK